MKKATLLNTALLLTVAAASPGAAVGASTQLQVKGVIRPSACVASLPGGGTINYPDATYRSLSQTSFTKFATREIDLSISCDAPTKMGIRTIDNRSGSKVAPPDITDKGAMYGLGTVGNTNIGALDISMMKLRGDSGPLDLLVRGGQSNATWARNAAGTVRADQTLSWGAVGSLAVGSYQRITATLAITPFVNRASMLPATEIINLDGAATIELVYL